MDSMRNPHFVQQTVKCQVARVVRRLEPPEMFGMQVRGGAQRPPRVEVVHAVVGICVTERRLESEALTARDWMRC